MAHVVADGAAAEVDAEGTDVAGVSGGPDDAASAPVVATALATVAAVAADTLSLSPLPWCGRSSVTVATTTVAAKSAAAMSRREGRGDGSSTQAVSRRDGAWK